MSGHRQDIDGLRGIAVLAITLFHINPTFLKGGFIGVDVFFVISGYLISRNICHELQQESFSFAEFYARRIRRLFPALFGMLLAAFLASYMLLLPAEFVAFSKSLFSAALYVSNILFYRTIGYFNNADFAPLIHTWSLSVEEQFYLIMPLGMFLAFRYAPQRILLLVVAIGVLSFALSEVWVQSGRDNAAFYLMPSRVWQFAAGGAIALIPPPRWSSAINNILAAAGLAGILSCAAFFSKSVPFPGAWALLPTLSAALLILSGQSGSTLTGQVLSLPPMRFLGAISYSLYLYHWPVIVFYKLAFAPWLWISDQILLFLISLAAGTASYLLIEQPFRRIRTDHSRSALLAGGGIGSIIFASLALLVIAGQGLPGRLPEEVVKVAGLLEYPTLSARLDRCFLYSGNKTADDFTPERCIRTGADKPNVLLIGDSHAAHYYTALQQLFPDVNLSQAAASGCRPVLPHRRNHRCLDLMDKVFRELIPGHQFDVVIMSGVWFPNDLPALNRTIDAIAPHTDRIYVFGRIIHYDLPLPRLLASSILLGRKGAVDENPNSWKLVSSMDSVMKQQLNKKAHFISTTDILCPNRICTKMLNGSPIQYDRSHLTVEGARFVLNAMVASGQLDLTKALGSLKDAAAIQ
jgi:peptidoglycan/LPS O-acetylase OafA/YrhL